MLQHATQMHLEDTVLSETTLSQKTKQHMISLIRGIWDKSSPVAQTGENLPTMWQTQVQSLGQGESLEKEMATHSSILAWRNHGQRSVAGYRPWGHKESDMTE